MYNSLVPFANSNMLFWPHLQFPPRQILSPFLGKLAPGEVSPFSQPRHPIMAPLKLEPSVILCWFPFYLSQRTCPRPLPLLCVGIRMILINKITDRPDLSNISIYCPTLIGSNSNPFTMRVKEKGRNDKKLSIY